MDINPAHTLFEKYTHLSKAKDIGRNGNEHEERFSVVHAEGLFVVSCLITKLLIHMSLFTLYSQFPKYHLLFFISNSHCFYNTQVVLLCHDSRCFIKTCSADTKD